MGTDTPPDSGPIAGRYTLDHVIGAGASAIVHEGRDLVTDQPVAVKVYRLDGAARHRLQQRREIAALTRLRHPGLVTLYDGGVEPGPGGRTYLVTYLIKGPSLAQRLMDGPLDIRAVRDLTARLAAALAHIHSRGFIHRDVKPANILLEHGRVPRLADFGIARALEGTIATATGAVAYLAPEQVRGAPVEPAADVYALAPTSTGRFGCVWVCTAGLPVRLGPVGPSPWVAECSPPPGQPWASACAAASSTPRI